MISRIAKIVLLSVVFCLLAGASAYITLTLIIKSEEPVIVPELVGKDIVYALEFLSDLELNTKMRGSEYNPEIPKNHIVFQDPEPGAEIKRGRDVQIILSKGPPTMVIPDLRSLSLQETGIILEKNDMCRGIVSHSFHNDFEKDHIIAQFPRAGTDIDKKTCLDLLVSMGKRPEAYMMPDLINHSVDDAILAVEKSNLALEQINHQYQKNKPRNTILAQSPRSGFSVTEGTAVSLIVNRKPGEKSIDGLQEFSYAGLFRYRLDNGYLRKQIRVEMQTNGLTYELLNNYISPGEEIWLMIPRDEDAVVTLYENEVNVKTELFPAR